MTYHIQINESKLQEFLQIIASLKSLGVVDSYESLAKKLVTDSRSLSDEELLGILEKSGQEIQEGKYYTQEQVLEKIQNWKK